MNLYQILEHLLQQEQKADHQKQVEQKLKVKNLHQKTLLNLILDLNIERAFKEAGTVTVIYFLNSTLPKFLFQGVVFLPCLIPPLFCFLLESLGCPLQKVKWYKDFRDASDSL
jgi:hypothetical protein